VHHAASLLRYEAESTAMWRPHVMSYMQVRSDKFTSVKCCGLTGCIEIWATCPTFVWSTVKADTLMQNKLYLEAQVGLRVAQRYGLKVWLRGVA